MKEQEVKKVTIPEEVRLDFERTLKRAEGVNPVIGQLREIVEKAASQRYKYEFDSVLTTELINQGLSDQLSPQALGGFKIGRDWLAHKALQLQVGIAAMTKFESRGRSLILSPVSSKLRKRSKF